MTTTVTDSRFRAQFGEDVILDQVFRHQTQGFYIEVGAFDGVLLSNTFYFEQIGWSGILIEPILPACHKACESRPSSRVVHAACSKRGHRGTTRFTIAKGVPVLSFMTGDTQHARRCESEGAELIEIDVPVVSLDTIIQAEKKDPLIGKGPWAPNEGWRIDFVSIDVEGAEMDVLDGFDLKRFKPKVLVIENERESGAVVEPYLRDRGYRKFFRRVINDFYVRDDASTQHLKTSGLSVPQF